MVIFSIRHNAGINIECLSDEPFVGLYIILLVSQFELRIGGIGNGIFEIHSVVLLYISK